jgi:hypothetical protein
MTQLQPVKPSFSQSASLLHCRESSFSSAEQADGPLISPSRIKKEARFMAHSGA